MADPQRLPVEHDLPPELRDALGDDTETLGFLYNDLQELDDEAFAERFAGSLSTFRSVLAGTDHEFVVCVLGLSLGDEPGDDPIADAAIVSVHAPNDDGSVADLLYVADDAPRDQFLALPVRPGDCPPGTGQAASDLTVGGYRDVVSAMLYKKFDLLQEDLDAYASSYLRPLVRGLEAYAEANAR